MGSIQCVQRLSVQATTVVVKVTLNKEMKGSECETMGNNWTVWYKEKMHTLLKRKQHLCLYTIQKECVMSPGDITQRSSVSTGIMGVQSLIVIASSPVPERGFYIFIKVLPTNGSQLWSPKSFLGYIYMYICMFIDFWLSSFVAVLSCLYGTKIQTNNHKTEQ